jgi:protein-L-isoaspartate(D-aspartate) O-methyltransferase
MTTPFEDTYRQKGLRRKLAELMREREITDAAVLKAIEQVPRHLFFDKAFLEFAYQDKAFPIAAGQTISQPYTVAFQTQLLQIRKGDRVLEIGTGSGYQTAVLLACGARVWTIERQRTLYDVTRALLPQMGYSPNFQYGDGYKGWPAFAPFDKILVTCGAPFVPDALMEQLKPGGRLVIPVGEGDTQEMTLITKDEHGKLTKTLHGLFRFVPMLGEREWKG